MTGAQLKAWREAKGVSKRGVAEQLDISHAAMNRWENGQQIPGPATNLLDLLINGQQPFTGQGPQTDAEAEARHFWKLRLDLEQWHALEADAKRTGYATVREI